MIPCRNEYLLAQTCLVFLGIGKEHSMNLHQIRHTLNCSLMAEHDELELNHSCALLYHSCACEADMVLSFIGRLFDGCVK